MKCKLWIALSLLAAGAVFAQTNSWQNTGNGYWDVNVNWTHGFPAQTQALCQIVNSFAKTVTIDEVTTAFNPQTLTISNLVVRGNGVATNTLAVANAGSLVPLRVLNSFSISTSGALLVTNGAVVVEGPSWNVDGTVEVREGGSVSVLKGSTTAGLSSGADLRIRGGSMILSNLSVSLSPSSTLTMSSGTLTIQRLCYIAGGASGNGFVWLTGGRLVNTNASSEMRIGSSGRGSLTISNGTVLAGFARVGLAGSGTLAIHGGTFAAQSLFQIGVSGGSGTVWVTNGQLVITNTPATVGVATGMFVDGTCILNRGRLAISNGVAIVGRAGAGTLTINGGTMTAPNLILGNFACTARGDVQLNDGNLTITNNAGTAPLDIRNGTFTLNDGLLTVDRIVLTNLCAQFVWNGGTIAAGAVILAPAADADGDSLPNDWEQLYGLDPLQFAGDDGPTGDPDGDGTTNLEEFLAGTDPQDGNSLLRITAITPEGANIRVTWQTAPDRTNRLQFTTGDGGGNFTNNFTDLTGNIFTTGTTTNHLHPGGATPLAHYYRVRVIP